MIEEENLNAAIIENNYDTYLSAYQEDSNETHYEETYNELVTSEVEQEKYQNLLTKHRHQFMI